MYDNEMIECKNESLNHYLHHFDECDAEHIQFNEELGCLDLMAECAEEILWNEL